MFDIRQVCEKYLANGKDIFWAFMDLENVSDTIDRHGMWQMLTVYGAGGKLLKAVQSFYADSLAFVRVGNDVSEWFPVDVGLRQGCQMSPWLFNVGAWDGKGLELLSAYGGRFEINPLLFADDAALVA